MIARNWQPVAALIIGALAIVAYAAFWLAVIPPAHGGEARCGKASWYGPAHQGHLMANGKLFNMNAMTAAMWDVPLGSRWIVRNVQNGKSVQIVITDRGPARRLNRVIDLSKAAAARLGMIDAGVALVCVERL